MSKRNKLGSFLKCLITVGLLGCSATTSTSGSHSGRPCVRNFHTEGSTFTGKAFTTYVELASSSADAVYNQLVSGLPKFGFVVLKRDARARTLETVHKDTYEASPGRAASMKVVIDTSNRPYRLQLSFKTLALQYTSEADVQKNFCDLISLVETESVEY